MGDGASLQNQRRVIRSGFILESLLYLHIFSTSYDLTRYHCIGQIYEDCHLEEHLVSLSVDQILTRLP